MARPANPELKPRMLEEARRSLLRDGWGGFSLRKVAREVGCSQTAVYLHFDNKDALVHALIDEGMGLLFEQLVAANVSAPEPRERIERMCRAYMTFGLANREYYEIMFNLPPEQMERYPSDKYKRATRNLGLFEEALAEAWGIDDPKHRDVRLSATSIWSTLHGTLCLMVNQRTDFSLPQADVIASSVRLAMSMVDLGPASDAD